MKSKKLSKLFTVLSMSLSLIAFSGISVQAKDTNSSQLYEKVIINGKEVINYTTKDKQSAEKDSLERMKLTNTQFNNERMLVSALASTPRTRSYVASAQSSENSNVKLSSSLFLSANLSSISSLSVTGGTTVGTLDGTNPAYANSITLSQTTTTAGVGVSTAWPVTVQVNGKTGVWTGTKYNAYKLEAPRDTIAATGMITAGMNILVEDSNDTIIGNYVYKAKTSFRKTFDNVYYNTNY